MNVNDKRIPTLLIVAMMILSVSTIFPIAAAPPLLPQLEVKPGTGTAYDVWLSGEGGASLDPYWDIIGFDLYMRYTGTVTLANIKVDPDGYFASFYPLGISITIKTRDNTRGFLRAAFTGKGVHTPPSGVGRILEVVFTSVAGIPHLRNPEPRPDELPFWGRDKFIVDVAGSPHPERLEAPWNGEPGSPWIPHIVLPTLPTASFTASATTVYKGQNIDFDASGSSDQAPGSIVKYEWDFESDGIIDAMGVTASKIFTTAGKRLVTLIVTDNDGLTGTYSETMNWMSRPPVVVCTKSPTTPVYTGVSVTFDATGTYDPDGTISMVFFDWMDGQPVTIDSAAPFKQSHKWAFPGTFNVRITARDSDYTDAYIDIPLTILDGLPRALFTASATTVYTFDTVLFDASASYDPDGTVDKYSWEFTQIPPASSTMKATDTDMYTVLIAFASNEKHAENKIVNTLYDPDEFIYRDLDTNGLVTHGDERLTKVGSYLAGSKVNATAGDTDIGTALIAFASNEKHADPPSGTPPAPNGKYDPGESIYRDVDASGKVTHGDVRLTKVGSYLAGSTANINNIVTMSWAKAYTYKALLEVFDNLGVTSAPEIFGLRTRTNVTITVLNRAPVAIFTESASSVYRDEVIFFDASGSYDLDGTILYYYWDFGDGTTGTGKTTSHAYSTSGDFKVTLTVTDDELAASTAVAYKSVSNARMPPDALTVTRAWAEHAVYSVSGDEDQYNTLYTEVQNLWSTSVDVKVVLTIFDFRTGGIAGTLQATGTALAGQTLILEADCDPATLDYIPGTRTKYTAYGQLYYFDGAWNPVETPYGTFKIEFKVVP